MSYYMCLRCKYKTKLKSDMKRHLKRQLKCGKDLDSYNYTDMEIFEKSLTIINDEKLENNKNKLECEYCKKVYSRIDALNRHKKNNCKKNEETKRNQTNNIQYINNQTNIQNNNNNIIIINNNTPNTYNLKSFDEEWSIEHFDNYIKSYILFSNTKYTDFLSEILKNKDNLNVIVEKDSESGLVYKNENEMFVKMKVNEILSQSMNKIYEQIQKMIDEVLSTKNLQHHFVGSLRREKMYNDSKYEGYVKDSNTKSKVDQLLLDIFNKKKDDAIYIARNLENEMEQKEKIEY
jgi:hypothetical protein